MGLECKCFFFATIKKHFAAVFLPEWWAVDFLFDIHALIRACACEQTGCCLFACKCNTLWACSCLRQVNMIKHRSHICSKTMIPTATLSQTAVWHLYARPWPDGNLSLSVLPCFPFSGHCIYGSSKRTKALFCYWSGSFWFGLTARTIIGTGGALQCTFHTALAKSCKRDWFREVWHQSWLHDIKSY